MPQGDTHITPKQWRELVKPKRQKYRNVPVTIEAIRHDSKKEGRRAQDLRVMEQAGLIRDLVLDKRKLRYPLVVNGVKIGVYTADARYYENGVLVVEDTKSEATRKERSYRRTKRLMLALYRIKIRET
jgi:hypothetical protein